MYIGDEANVQRRVLDDSQNVDLHSYVDGAIYWAMENKRRRSDRIEYQKLIFGYVYFDINVY